MNIAGRRIAPGEPVYVIAELGVNHDGDAGRALELVRLAAGAGADAIKLQLFEADRLMGRESKLAAYQASAGERDPLDMLRRLQLSIEDMAPCVRLAHELGVHAIVSVFSVELVEVAQRLPWDAYKTASPDIVNKPLLDEIARTGRPLIVSTGASTLEEVRRARSWLEPARDRLAFLQCVSSYPTPAEHAELGGIGALLDALPGVGVGYSDHTEDEVTGLLAAQCGAQVLEKHFTYSRGATGPDHRASLEPAMFSAYVNSVRVGLALPGMMDGSLPAELRHAMALASEPPAGLERVKRVLPIEEDVRRVSRQSLTTARPLRAGHRLERGDLTIKRPGTGLAPYELEGVLGRVAARDLEGDVPLRAGDVR